MFVYRACKLCFLMFYVIVSLWVRTLQGLTEAVYILLGFFFSHVVGFLYLPDITEHFGLKERCRKEITPVLKKKKHHTLIPLIFLKYFVRCLICLKSPGSVFGCNHVIDCNIVEVIVFVAEKTLTFVLNS